MIFSFSNYYLIFQTINSKFWLFSNSFNALTFAFDLRSFLVIETNKLSISFNNILSLDAELSLFPY